MRKTSPNRVLLVDDDPSLRALLSRQLEREGFEIDEAEDGIGGVVKLRIELPKVIISDLQMPRMAGIEFLSVVRRRFPFIPVVVLSELISKEVPAAAEPEAWLEKGALSMSELLQTLRDLVRQTSERTDLPQVVTTPIRTESGFAGYFMLNCPDCLRTSRSMSTPENKTVERTPRESSRGSGPKKRF